MHRFIADILLLLIFSVSPAIANEIPRCEITAVLKDLFRDSNRGETLFPDLKEKSPRFYRLLNSGMLERGVIEEGSAFEHFYQKLITPKTDSFREFFSDGTLTLDISVRSHVKKKILEVRIGSIKLNGLAYTDMAKATNTNLLKLMKTIMAGVSEKIRVLPESYESVRITGGMVVNGKLQDLLGELGFEEQTNFMRKITNNANYYPVVKAGSAVKLYKGLAHSAGPVTAPVELTKNLSSMFLGATKGTVNLAQKMKYWTFKKNPNAGRGSEWILELDIGK